MDLFRTLKILKRTNHNEVHSVIARQCTAIQPAVRPRRIVQGIDKVSHNRVTNRLYIAVLLREMVDFAKLLNSAGRGWPSDLWSGDLLINYLLQGIVKKDYWMVYLKERNKREMEGEEKLL